ncbi:hypothetical protein HO133_009889 [Letharia lupina]|uniref:Uncharacterized protein n=1 Tax=Letharia lupina TaxID=560253 RepID=A0A8H6CLU8_9LECA|nr:uncharacterized protein HO133_009889 [Letharia lupina]KAF6225887.1 hypothetical protein HO133_009889 [Letharia lupina]
MQQAASSIKDKRIKVLIYYAFDKAIAARSEVTSHFKGPKAIFESLCSDGFSSSKAKETSSTSTPDPNPFETLSNLQIESDSPSASGNEDNEADEAHYEHSKDGRDDAGDDGIKDDVFVQDLELCFVLWVRSAFLREVSVRTDPFFRISKRLAQRSGHTGPMLQEVRCRSYSRPFSPTLPWLIWQLASTVDDDSPIRVN